MNEISPTFGYWFAGFTDADGHFMIRTGYRKSRGKTYRDCRLNFSIGQRADGISVLRYIQENVGCGNITGPYSSPPCKPMFLYRITNTPDLWTKLAPIFWRFPLQSKKGLEFPLWAKAIEIHHNAIAEKRWLTEREWQWLKDLNSQIREIRTYKNQRE